MPERDLALLIGAAEAAGAIARRFWRRNPEAWEKPGLGPVTEVDLAIDRMLREELLNARPDYGWLSEETVDAPDERLSSTRCFIIDPIDGTRAFIAGEETYAHSLAMAVAGRIAAAVVYLPQMEQLYTAGEVSPAMLNGRPIAVSLRPDLTDATLLAATATMKPDHWRDGQVPPVRRVFRASLAYRMSLVAEGRFDAMVAPGGIWEWDIAAGDLIVRRAGGRVTDRDGAEIRFNAPTPRNRGLIAAPPALHDMLLSQLLPHPA